MQNGYPCTLVDKSLTSGSKRFDDKMIRIDVEKIQLVLVLSYVETKSSAFERNIINITEKAYF